jgi:hypothetical protein
MEIPFESIETLGDEWFALRIIRNVRRANKHDATKNRGAGQHGDGCVKNAVEHLFPL